MKKLSFILLILSSFCLSTLLMAKETPKILIKKIGKDKVIVKYQKYGEFSGIGTEKYRYQIKKLKKLIKAVGEGIYPNKTSILKNKKACYNFIS